MELKEINILQAIVLEILGAQKYQDLKTNLVTEDGYQNFLVKFFQIIIDQEKEISLYEFLELHKLADKLPEFENKKNDIIEEFADEAFKGYSSVYTAWLLESKNEIFLNHISFLKEINIGISITERDEQRKKNAAQNDINNFEISEDEIKIAFKLIERKRIKDRLEELSRKNKDQHIETQKPRKLKYSTIFVFMLISAFGLALAIPKVRAYIIEKTHELFNKTNPQEKEITQSTSSKPVAFNKIKTDTLNVDKQACADSITQVPKTNNKPIPKNANALKSNEVKKSINRIGNASGLQNQKEFEDYFVTNKTTLDNIEGIWNFQGIFTKEYDGYNATKIKFAIVKNANKYDMIWLNRNGTKNNQASQFYLYTVAGRKEIFSLKEHNDSTEISQTKAYLNSKKNSLSFEMNISSERFKFPNAGAAQMIDCKFTGIKQDLFEL